MGINYMMCLSFLRNISIGNINRVSFIMKGDYQGYSWEVALIWEHSAKVPHIFFTKFTFHFKDYEVNLFFTFELVSPYFL